MSLRNSVDNKITTKTDKNLMSTTTKNLTSGMEKYFLVYFTADNTTVVLSKDDLLDYKGHGLVGDTVKVKYDNEIFSGKILFAADDEKSVESYTMQPTSPSRKRERISSTPPKSAASPNPFTDKQISFLQSNIIDKLNACPILHTLEQNVKALNDEMKHCFQDMNQIKEATGNMARSMKNLASLLFRMANRNQKEFHEQETQTDEPFPSIRLITDYSSGFRQDNYDFNDDDDCYDLQTFNTQIKHNAKIEYDNNRDTASPRPTLPVENTITIDSNHALSTQVAGTLLDNCIQSNADNINSHVTVIAQPTTKPIKMSSGNQIVLTDPTNMGRQYTIDKQKYSIVKRKTDQTLNSDCNSTRHLLHHLINSLYSFHELEKGSIDGKISHTVSLSVSRMTTIDNHMLKLYGSHYETYRKSKLCAAKQRESFRAQKSYLSKDKTTALAIT
ncbi:unnamed protein product [Didymodactylos carnosus]|uniref:Uncharacterized protein n=1 Tax=Didymodactylos carnosus TaxID=1234261 RepID=A0A8S2EGL1_9BILA|nr:unnamed protein product [Didymodactylos carnosus]CAF4026989.1 unnamed protein product [Didymodactylos carnosus]